MKRNKNYNKQRTFHDTAWLLWKDRKGDRKHEWWVWWNYEAIAFVNRNAAIMWLKRYAKENTFYMLKDRYVKVINGIVYFYNWDYGLGICAEPKRMCVYGQRNN